MLISSNKKAAFPCRFEEEEEGEEEEQVWFSGIKVKDLRTRCSFALP